MSVEKYHCFLKKTLVMSGQYRGTHEVFLQNLKTSQYSWNSAPIDRIYILRIFAAAGCEFRFPLDVKLLQTPKNLNQGNSDMYEYIWNVSNKTQFEMSILTDRAYRTVESKSIRP